MCIQTGTPTFIFHVGLDFLMMGVVGAENDAADLYFFWYFFISLSDLATIRSTMAALTQDISKIHKNPDIRGIWCSYWNFVPWLGGGVDKHHFLVWLVAL